MKGASGFGSRFFIAFLGAAWNSIFIQVSLSTVEFECRSRATSPRTLVGAPPLSLAQSLVAPRIVVWLGLRDCKAQHRRGRRLPRFFDPKNAIHHSPVFEKTVLHQCDASSRLSSCLFLASCLAPFCSLGDGPLLLPHATLGPHRCARPLLLFELRFGGRVLPGLAAAHPSYPTPLRGSISTSTGTPFAVRVRGICQLRSLCPDRWARWNVHPSSTARPLDQDGLKPEEGHFILCPCPHHTHHTHELSWGSAESPCVPASRTDGPEWRWACVCAPVR